MHDTIKTSHQQPTTFLGRIGADPSRLMTIRDWWRENEPVDLLFDPDGTLRGEEQTMLKLCDTNGIPYRPATDAKAAAFPVWLFLTV